MLQAIDVPQNVFRTFILFLVNSLVIILVFKPIDITPWLFLHLLPADAGSRYKEPQCCTTIGYYYRTLTVWL